MKNIIILMLMISILGGCGNKEEEPTPIEDNQDVVTEEPIVEEEIEDIPPELDSYEDVEASTEEPKIEVESPVEKAEPPKVDSYVEVVHTANYGDKKQTKIITDATAIQEIEDMFIVTESDVEPMIAGGSFGPFQITIVNNETTISYSLTANEDEDGNSYCQYYGSEDDWLLLPNSNAYMYFVSLFEAPAEQPVAEVAVVIPDTN